MIGLVNGQPIAAGVRTYADTQDVGAPLSVTQFPSTSVSDGATHLGAEVVVDVGGAPGIFQTQVDPTTGASVASSLSWSVDGWVFVLASFPELGDQQPLGEGELLAVADGLVPTETAPPGAPTGW